jgi:hypothetical protein
VCIVVFVFSHIIYFSRGASARANLSLYPRWTNTLRWRRDFHLFVCASLSHAQKKKAAACAARNVHASHQPERDLIWRGGGRDTRRAQKHTQAHRICLRLNRFFSFSWESCVWEKTDPKRARLKDERKRDLQRAPSVRGALHICLDLHEMRLPNIQHDINMSNCCAFNSNVILYENHITVNHGRQQIIAKYFVTNCSSSN